MNIALEAFGVLQFLVFAFLMLFFAGLFYRRTKVAALEKNFLGLSVGAAALALIVLLTTVWALEATANVPLIRLVILGVVVAPSALYGFWIGVTSDASEFEQ